MTISQLITQLEALLAKHGDLPVTTSGDTGDHDEPLAARLDEGTFFDEGFGRQKGHHIHIS